MNAEKLVMVVAVAAGVAVSVMIAWAAR